MRLSSNTKSERLVSGPRNVGVLALIAESEALLNLSRVHVDAKILESRLQLIGEIAVND